MIEGSWKEQESCKLSTLMSTAHQIKLRLLQDLTLDSGVRIRHNASDAEFFSHFNFFFLNKENQMYKLVLKPGNMSAINFPNSKSDTLKSNNFEIL